MLVHESLVFLVGWTISLIEFVNSARVRSFTFYKYLEIMFDRLPRRSFAIKIFGIVTRLIKIILRNGARLFWLI